MMDFSCILTGRFRNMVYGWNGTEETLLHRSHSILMVFTPFYMYFSPQILIFQELLIVGISNQCHWIQTHLEPYIHATQSILMQFSQSKATKCEIFGCLHNFSYQILKKKINFNKLKVL